jgi:predicted transposase YdaD
LQEGERQGEQKGRQEGRQEEKRSLILKLLTRRVGALSPELAAQVQALSPEQLEALGEALLDFTQQQELVNWLENNHNL